MGTRAVYVFKEESRSFCVYKHWDNYPEGAAGFLTNTIDNAWPLPRYEADEFAAAFIAANKRGGGDCRYTDKPESHADIEYVYEVLQAKNGQLIVHAYSVNFWGDEPKYEELFYGRMKDFVAKFGHIDGGIKPIGYRISPRPVSLHFRVEYATL